MALALLSTHLPCASALRPANLQTRSAQIDRQSCVSGHASPKASSLARSLHSRRCRFGRRISASPLAAFVEGGVTDVAVSSQSWWRRNVLLLAGTSGFSMLFADRRSGAAVASASAPESAAISPPATVFVAGATGQTGRRVVRELLAAGYSVRAGVRDLEKGQSLVTPGGAIELVRADVTEGVDALAEAIGDASAVVCATGFAPSLDPTLAWKVDNLGTVNLVDACNKRGVRKFVLVSSILTNGAATGQILNPNYLLLNLFGLVLIAKLQAERYIERTGVDYTIVRPGGLSNGPPTGNIVMRAEDTLSGGAISRDYVAQVVVQALSLPDASFKTVEIVASPDEPALNIPELFAALKK